MLYCTVWPQYTTRQKHRAIGIDRLCYGMGGLKFDYLDTDWGQKYESGINPRSYLLIVVVITRATRTMYRNLSGFAVPIHNRFQRSVPSENGQDTSHRRWRLDAGDRASAHRTPDVDHAGPGRREPLVPTVLATRRR